MTTALSGDQLKDVFRNGWNHPGRVGNYVENIAEKEFTTGPSAEAWKRALAAALNAEQPQRVLDVGTGPGVYACLYAQLGHACVGLDFSESMVAAARQRAERLAGDCTFVLGDAEAPPFPDGSFDAVSSRHVLYTLPHPGVAVRQWARVLKPGGVMILIGDEVSDRRGSAFSNLLGAVKRRLRIGASNRSIRGWKASPEYHRALAECPLSKYHVHPLVLRAIMEAVGLESIRSVDTEEIVSARAAQRSSGRKGFEGARHPFILTGVKP